jgi:methionine salvage enolase-phosphatase E1
LRAESNSVAQIFERPFRDILQDFDKNAVKLLSGRPWAHGFASGALKEAFPEIASQVT